MGNAPICFLTSEPQEWAVSRKCGSDMIPSKPRLVLTPFFFFYCEKQLMHNASFVEQKCVTIHEVIFTEYICEA